MEGENVSIIEKTEVSIKASEIKANKAKLEFKSRIKSIDIAKAIGIILIVLGHVSENGRITKFVYSFHVPLFFIISGYLYKQESKEIMFLKKKIKTIIVPYLAFGLLSFVYWFLIERNFREQNVNPLVPFCNLFIAQAGEYNFITNSALWFLPCLFCTEIIFDLLKRVLRKDNILFIGVLTICIIGCIYNELNLISLPLELNTAFIAIGFYFCGYLWKNKAEDLFKLKIKKRWISVMLIIICLIMVVIISEINQGIYMYDEIYNNYFLAYIGGILGTFLVYMISNLIARNKILEFIGQNTLIIMCIHEPIKRIFIEIIHIISKIPIEILRTNIISIFIITAILMIILFPLIILVNRFFPFFIGKTKKVKLYNT